jgi:hypothetical protein
MLRHRNRLLGAASVAVATAALAVSGLAAASAATPAASGTEQFQLMITSATSNTGPVIAHGVFTAGGIDHEGTTTATFTFANGTIKVRHSPGHGKQTFDPRTCLLTLKLHGTYRLVHGTGRYAGITGHGIYHLHILAVGARNARGRCSSSAPPVTFEQVINASGPVTLK